MKNVGCVPNKLLNSLHGIWVDDIVNYRGAKGSPIDYEWYSEVLWNVLLIMRSRLSAP